MNMRSLLKLAAASAVVAAISGCAVAPGDPYYDGGYSSGPVYSNGPVYGGPAYPVPVYTNRDRWEDMRDERERRAWRDRQGERDRARADWERDQRARDRDRDDRARRDADRARDDRARRDADRHNSDWARAQRERDLARAQRDQREAGNQPGRKPDGSPRTDFDRYNPKTGQWLPRQEDMP